MKENNNIKAKIITIGDELLLGQVINTNASWLGEQLNFNGFQLESVLTIGDGEKEILDAVIRKFKDYKAFEIVNYMHEERAYKETSNGAIIPFSLAKEIRNLDTNGR